MSNEIPPQNPTDDAMPVPQDPGVQWLNTHLSLRPELRFDVRNQSGETFVIIEDPVRSKFFQVGQDEYRFIASLNGKSTIAEVVENLGKSHPGLIDDEKAKAICQWLVTSNLVIGQEMDNLKRLNLQAQAISNQQLLGLLNPICFKLRLFNPNRALQAIQPYTQWLFHKSSFVIWAITALIALKIIYTKWDAIGDASVGVLAGGRWIWLLIVWTVLKLIHEAAHGIACRKYGGEVPDAGVLILLFTPMAFVNVTSSWRFPNRWQRIFVAAAGMYVELFLSFVAIIVWANINPGVVADVCFNIFITASVSTILFNANPLMRFDGYYILSDVLKVPNLYPKGTKWFGDLLKTTVFGTLPTPNICHSKEKLRVAVYGTMAFFWKILISLSLIIGSSVIFHGAGIILALVGVGLWFGLPIFKQLNSIFGPKATQQPNYKRMCISGLVIVLMSLSLFTVLRGPAAKSAPAIVQFKDELPLRALADGFVKEILIRDGQSVAQGDILIKLENPELESERLELQLQAEEAAIQTRIYQKTDETALAQAEQKKREGLLLQLAEKEGQVQGLVIEAPFDGFVFQRNLHNQIGDFVHRGDQILNIAQRQTKEIVVSIDQADLESIKGNEGELLRVAFPGTKVFQSELVRINPRANEKPTHPTLCAHAGGPLPVRQASDPSQQTSEAVELLSPRFTANLAVSTELANQLQSGQRGRAFFSTHRQSLGSYLYLAVADWFKNKLEQATLTAAF